MEVNLKRKVVASSKLAKELLSAGFPIIDISPHKNDFKRTVFVFHLTEKLEEYIQAKGV